MTVYLPLDGCTIKLRLSVTGTATLDMESWAQEVMARHTGFEPVVVQLTVGGFTSLANAATGLCYFLRPALKGWVEYGATTRYSNERLHFVRIILHIGGFFVLGTLFFTPWKDYPTADNPVAKEK